MLSKEIHAKARQVAHKKGNGRATYFQVDNTKYRTEWDNNKNCFVAQNVKKSQK